MSTQTETPADLSALDFAPSCDLPDHAAGNAGHVAAEPARWIVLVTHWADECRPFVLLLCDPFVQATTRELTAHFAADPTALLTEHLCGARGATLKSPTDLFAVIGAL